LNILIVEASDHYKVLENVYNLIKLNCKNSQLTFYVNKDKDNKARDLLFPDSGDAGWIENPLHFSQFFLYLLFFGWKYDVINISTGPEGTHYSNTLNVLYFYIVSRIYGKKIVLTIKNTRPYLKNTSGILSSVRSSSLKYLRMMTFETQTLMEVFHEESKIPFEKLGISYDRYTDLNTVTEKKSNNKTDYLCVIGLLGVVESERRNYYEIINALRKTHEDIRSKFLFVTLGNSKGGLDNEILFELSQLSKVDITEGWISAEEFEKRGILCDVLISPLKKEMEYGTYKGSGTFGDAIYLRKKLIIPSYTDPRKEFSEISMYYDSIDGLANIFNTIKDGFDNKITEDFYIKFTTKTIYKNLTKKFYKNKKSGEASCSGSNI